MKQFRIAISVGDIHGIGLEVVLKSLSDSLSKNLFSEIHICAHQSLVEQYAHSIEESETLKKVLSSRNIIFSPPPTPAPITLEIGTVSASAGSFALSSFNKACDLVSESIVDGIVTAPISKESVNLASSEHIPGHTELLAKRFGTDKEIMILVNEGLRVALVTGHIPISKIATVLNSELIEKKARILWNALVSDFGIKHPKIAILGLNPHSGDGGVIGEEEIKIIEPSIKRMQSKGMDVEGPFPADGFFGSLGYQDYDAILAMYHDQGLIPFKTLSFGKGVNVTSGLSIVRTSPDHGTAFSIVGKNLADHKSFLQALILAQKIIQNRR